MLNNSELNAKVEEMKTLQAQAKAIQDKADAIKKELQAELDARKVEKVSTDKFNIFWDAYERAGVDTALLKKEGLYEKFSKKSVVTSFKVTDVKIA